MKAAVVEEPGRYGVRDVPEPKLGDYDCLCRMLYGATCTGTDQHLIAGRLPFPVNYPTIMGHESVGRVVKLGPKVRSFKEGDLVTRVGHPGDEDSGLHSNWGGFAERGVARDHRAMKEDGVPRAEWDGSRVNQVLPEDIDPRAATMVITWRETLSYVTRMGVSEGANVLVIGSGGNGLSFISHARNLGASSVTMVGSAGRFDEGERAGANHSLDYKRDGLAEAIVEAQPGPYDFVIDAVGKVGMMDRVLSRLAPGGTVGVYGIDDHDAYSLNPWKVPGSFSIYNGAYDEEEVHARVIDFIHEGRLDASIWLDMDRAVPLAEFESAIESIRAREVVKALVQLG